MFRKLFLIGSSAMVGIAIAMFAHAGWFLLTLEDIFYSFDVRRCFKESLFKIKL